MKNEMNSDWPQVIAKLNKDQNYINLFGKLYNDGIQGNNIKDAISEYERSLITPSRFDKYLLGDKTALNESELKGYDLFKKYGCVACHQGINIGGNMYQLFGVMGDYFKERGNITNADLGYFNVSHDERDRHKFKVPSLRNIALTAPYFHDGSAKTLHDAVRVMAKYQLGRTIPEADEELIIQFLNALSGDMPNQEQGVKMKLRYFVNLIIGVCMIGVLVFLYAKVQSLNVKEHYEITDILRQISALNFRWNEDVLKPS